MDDLPKSDAVYDYIVIGAGSAGCAVAGRLGAAGYRVLLLEAGGLDRSPWIHVPLGYPKLFKNPKLNWSYRSAPEPNLNGRTLYQPRGKVLGGTGAINGMIYVRGQPEDFDGWAEAGCTGWGWKDVLPFFKTSEDQERGADAFHGIGGPLAVSDIPTKHKLGEAFLAASEALGSARNADFNGAAQDGTGYYQTTTRRGRRWTTAHGYLSSSAKQNVNVRLNALVSRLIIEDGIVRGVMWAERSGLMVQRVRREVLLCAGSFNSPQILKLSGVGPQSELRRHGIRVVNDLPEVGLNLQDHFGVGLEFKSLIRETVNDIYNNPIKSGIHFLRYLICKNGPFADNGNYCSTFIRTEYSQNRPDMMITMMAWVTSSGLKPRAFSGFSIFAEHLRPQARGYTRLTGASPTDPPEIRFNFLESEADRQSILAGLKYARTLSQTRPLVDCIERELSPGPCVQTEDAFLSFCRDNGGSMHHAVGTCRMGSDGNSVVDPKLRVRGLRNLRVIDASVMPLIVSGNTNAATIMIAEKGAQMVIEDARASG